MKKFLTLALIFFAAAACSQKPNQPAAVQQSAAVQQKEYRSLGLGIQFAYSGDYIVNESSSTDVSVYHNEPLESVSSPKLHIYSVPDPSANFQTVWLQNHYADFFIKDSQTHQLLKSDNTIDFHGRAASEQMGLDNGSKYKVVIVPRQSYYLLFVEDDKSFEPILNAVQFLPVETAGWQDFSDAYNGISFKYPPTLVRGFDKNTGAASFEGNDGDLLIIVNKEPFDPKTLQKSDFAVLIRKFILSGHDAYEYGQGDGPCGSLEIYVNFTIGKSLHISSGGCQTGNENYKGKSSVLNGALDDILSTFQFRN